MTPPKLPPKRTIRGYPMAEICEREGVSRRTAWRWVEKGLLEVSRLGPRTGVRVRYANPDDDRDRR